MGAHIKLTVCAFFVFFLSFLFSFALSRLLWSGRVIDYLCAIRKWRSDEYGSNRATGLFITSILLESLEFIIICLRRGLNEWMNEWSGMVARVEDSNIWFLQVMSTTFVILFSSFLTLILTASLHSIDCVCVPVRGAWGGLLFTVVCHGIWWMMMSHDMIKKSQRKQCKSTLHDNFTYKWNRKMDKDKTTSFMALNSFQCALLFGVYGEIYL